jgi:Fe2+ transport system protein FeoA
MPQNDAVVLIPSRYGVLEGKSIETVSILCMGQPEGACLVWKILLDDIQQGQCGSWILDEEGDKVLGILVAACPALSEAYILPMKDIVADIIARKVGREVNLPQDPTSILHKAVMVGNAESIETALSQNLDRDLMFHADYGYSKIYQAAESGNLAVVKQLIKEGADLDRKRSILTVSPIFEAVRLQHITATQRLLEAGFNPNVGVTLKEYAPLYICIVQGYTDIAVALIEAGAATAAIYTVRTNLPLMAVITTNQLQPGEVKSASDMEKEYPNEGIRLAIKRREEAAEMLKEEEQQTKDDGEGAR